MRLKFPGWVDDSMILGNIVQRSDLRKKMTHVISGSVVWGAVEIQGQVPKAWVSGKKLVRSYKVIQHSSICLWMDNSVNSITCLVLCLRSVLIFHTDRLWAIEKEHVSCPFSWAQDRFPCGCDIWSGYLATEWWENSFLWSWFASLKLPLGKLALVCTGIVFKKKTHD